MPLIWTEGTRDLASRVATWLSHAGIRAAPHVEEVWRSLASLADPEARRAFFRTLRAVVDLGGQAVSATDRLYLAAQVPTLIVWGERDPFIPVDHALAAHQAIPGSRLEIFEDVGHFPHCEAPARFIEVLVDFVKSTVPVRVSPQTPSRDAAAGPGAP
jgi:pimeloyl-ACP methyl ester carboxylesterase